MGEPLTADERHCKKCFYHFIFMERICCEFILVTGKRRACEFGRKCTRFLAGNPRTRWGLDPMYELAPGYLPGAAAQKKSKSKLRRRVPMDMKAWKRLRANHTAREMAELTGTSKSLWSTNIQQTKSINPDLAEKVFTAYGIDLIQK